MRLQRWTSCAMGVGVALALAAMAEVKAQDTSQVRIPIRKGTSTNGVTSTGVTTTTGVTRRESGGDIEVARVTMVRIDSLEMTYPRRTRRDSTALEAANASAARARRLLEARINALADSLATTRNELATARTELAAANARIDRSRHAAPGPERPVQPLPAPLTVREQRLLCRSGNRCRLHDRVHCVMTWGTRAHRT